MHIEKYDRSQETFYLINATTDGEHIYTFSNGVDTAVIDLTSLTDEQWNSYDTLYELNGDRIPVIITRGKSNIYTTLVNSLSGKIKINPKEFYEAVEDEKIVRLRRNTLSSSTNKQCFEFYYLSKTTPGYGDKKLTFIGGDDSIATIDISDVNWDSEVPVNLSIEFSKYEFKHQDLVIPIKYLDLVDLRDAGDLIPGVKYRIIDYDCGVGSASNKFDIIVTAIDSNTLSENALASQPALGIIMAVDQDEYELSEVLTDEIEGVLYKWDYLSGPETYYTKELIASPCTIDVLEYDGSKYVSSGTFELTDVRLPEYFSKCNLNAWELKYTLENNTTKYPWVSEEKESIKYSGSNHFAYITKSDDADSEYPYIWEDEDGAQCYTKMRHPVIGDKCIDEGDVEHAIESKGDGSKGVIYYMKDEFNNEAGYDFKNIQFTRKIDAATGAYDATNGVDTSCYTFSVWNTDHMEDASLNSDGVIRVYNNKLASNESIEKASKLCMNNVWIQKDTNATAANIANSISNNELGSASRDNTFGNMRECHFGYGMMDNVIGTSAERIYAKDAFQHNTLGTAVKRFIAGIGASNNTIGDTCYDTTVGNIFQHNTIGNNCLYNTFLDKCSYNNLGNDCQENQFLGNCSYITLEDSCLRNEFHRKCANISLTRGSFANVFENTCQYIEFSNISALVACHFEPYCQNITLTSDIGNQIQCSRFGAGAKYVTLHDHGTNTTGGLNNVYVMGLKGTSGNILTIDINHDDYSNQSNPPYIYIGRNTSNEVKQFVLADLIN